MEIQPQIQVHLKINQVIASAASYNISFHLPFGLSLTTTLPYPKWLEPLSRAGIKVKKEGGKCMK